MSDSAAAEPARKRSRFDRRSRSPEGRDNDNAARPSGQTPETTDQKSPAPTSAAAAAVLAAKARINAQIEAKKAAGVVLQSRPVRPSP